MNWQIRPLQVDEPSGRGSITWNLPESIQFIPGDTIPITVTITNPTDEERLYSLGWMLIRNGAALVVALVEIEGCDCWVVDANSSEELSFELSPEYSDCYLNLALVGGVSREGEEEEAEIIDSLTTYLYSTTIQPAAVTAQWVELIVPAMVAIMMLVYIAGMVRDLFRGEEVKLP